MTALLMSETANCLRYGWNCPEDTDLFIGAFSRAKTHQPENALRLAVLEMAINDLKYEEHRKSAEDYIKGHNQPHDMYHFDAICREILCMEPEKVRRVVLKPGFRLAKEKANRSYALRRSRLWRKAQTGTSGVSIKSVGSVAK